MLEHYFMHPRVLRRLRSGGLATNWAVKFWSHNRARFPHAPQGKPKSNS